MYTNGRTNQRGSIAIFLVVSVLFASAVVGGAYLLQQRGAHVREAEPIAQNKSNQDQSKEDTQKQAAEDQAKQQAEQQAQAEKQAAEARKKAEAEKTAAAEAEKRRQQEQRAAASIPQTGVTPQASHLPQTGPEDYMAQVISGAVLFGVVFAYLKSYRHRFGSLLR